MSKIKELLLVLEENGLIKLHYSEDEAKNHPKIGCSGFEVLLEVGNERMLLECMHKWLHEGILDMNFGLGLQEKRLSHRQMTRLRDMFRKYGLLPVERQQRICPRVDFEKGRTWVYDESTVRYVVFFVLQVFRKQSSQHTTQNQKSRKYPLDPRLKRKNIPARVQTNMRWLTLEQRSEIQAACMQKCREQFEDAHFMTQKKYVDMIKERNAELVKERSKVDHLKDQVVFFLVNVILERKVL